MNLCGELGVALTSMLKGADLLSSSKYKNTVLGLDKLKYKKSINVGLSVRPYLAVNHVD